MAYKTKRVYVHARAYDIPVGDDGYVPEVALRKRFQNRSVGVSNGKKSRNIVQDYDSYADVVLPEKLTPEQAAAWWHRPSEYDIEGIDTPGPVKTRKGIKFHGTDMEVEKMGEMIDATHTPAEVRKIAEEGAIYTARPLNTNVKGRYMGNAWIEINRENGMEHQTVAHETTHMMRDRDGKRKDILIKRNAATNIEESCTIAEQMARSREKDLNGYYWMVPVFDKETRRWRKPTDAEVVQMCREDYALFTYGRGKPLKEKEAMESVEKNWVNSNISRLRCNSRRMAISDLARQDRSFEKKKDEVLSNARGPSKPKKSNATSASSSTPGMAPANLLPKKKTSKTKSKKRAKS